MGFRWADQDSDLDLTKSSRPPLSTLSPSNISHPSGVSTLRGKGSVSFSHAVPPFGVPPSVPTAPEFEPRYLRTPGEQTGVPMPSGSPISNALEDASAPHTPFGMGTYHNTTIPLRPREWAKEVDPTAVFVGGLDAPENWDEVKLQHIFGRFGAIESVQLVKPRTLMSAC